MAPPPNRPGAAPLRRVVVTGSAGMVGRLVLDRLVDDDGVESIVSLDTRRLAVAHPKVEHHAVELAADDLKPLLEGVDTLVHLAWRPPLSPTVRTTGSVEATRRVLDAAGAVGVRHVVHLGSATVYGAWPNNPVPLTEAAPLRPNPGFLFATEHAEAERVLAMWRDDHPDATTAVLRPTVVVAAGREPWLARTVGGALPLRPSDPVPSQFVHAEDVASAVVLAVTSRLDGVWNVAPDAAIPGDTVRALAGGTLTLPLPEPWVRRFRHASWRLRIGDVPPHAVPYTIHPWVIASDRLRAEGWQPSHTNEEALVAARRGSWWRELSPKRRQEVTLGAAAAAGLGTAAAVAAVVRSRLRRGDQRR